ncbi:hypothetical protein AAD018_010980 [Aestuariibius insulae]|uniref:hypothetical protein n=1 Tax=Aestuariibius insulae TaxID=2058287 RepID=UPI00345E1C8F
MDLRTFLITVTSSVAFAQTSIACSFTRPPPEWQQQLSSQSVAVGLSCSFENAGLTDHISAGPAKDLGSGQIYQRVNDQSYFVMFADCNTREATLLWGPPTPSAVEDSCGYYDGYEALVGDDAILSRTTGGNLHEFVAAAKDLGATELNPIKYLNETPSGKPVWRRDRIDLLCGCRIFYPDSPGAQR